MKLPKIKLPQIQLGPILLVIFLSMVIIEGLVLYKVFYLDPRQPVVQTGGGGAAPTVQVDLKAYKEAVFWLNGQKNYQNPGFVLREGGQGRENPLAEY